MIPTSFTIAAGALNDAEPCGPRAPSGSVSEGVHAPQNAPGKSFFEGVFFIHLSVPPYRLEHIFISIQIVIPFKLLFNVTDLFSNPPKRGPRSGLSKALFYGLVILSEAIFPQQNQISLPSDVPPPANHILNFSPRIYLRSFSMVCFIFPAS